MSKVFKLFLAFVSLLSVLILIQCGKSTNPEPEYSLIGDWRWVQSELDLGIYGVNIILTPESENMYRMYEFHDDSTYTVTEIASSLKDSFSAS